MYEHRHRDVLTVIVLAGTTSWACGGRHDTPATESTPVAVTVAASAMTDRAETFEAGGVVRGRTSATLSSRVMATVRDVLVQPGTRVRTGQVLVRLDDRDVSAAAREARARSGAAERAVDVARAEQAAAAAALTLAQTMHGRIAALHDRKSATTQELDQAVASLRGAEARVARAQASLSEAEAQLDGSRASNDAAGVTLSYASITAPFDGVVTEKLVDPGNLVAPGTPLVRLEDTRTFELEVRVDESRASGAAANATIPVAIDSPDGAVLLTGHVSEVARAVDADTRTLLVTIALPPSPALSPGVYGRASFPGATHRRLTVPDAAVIRQGQLTSVFVIEGDRARLRFVSVGRSSSGGTDILAGLSEGESVVVAPPPAVRDGTRVTVRRAAALSSSGAAS